MRTSLSQFIAMHETALDSHFWAVENAELDALPDEYTMSDTALFKELQARAMRDSMFVLGFV